MSAPVLSGDLRAFPLADILLMLNNNRKTGALRCRQAQVEKTIEYENGEIVFARSSLPEDRLGPYLVSRGRITQEQLDKAAAALPPGERLGKVLIQMGLLEAQDLFAVVRGQIKEVIYSLFHWKEGRFEFAEGDVARNKITMDTSVMNVIMEGTRRLDEWSRIKEKIHSDGVILTPIRSLEEATRSVKLSDFEKMVMSLVDGRRTVKEVVALAGSADFETWQALYSLLSAGMIRTQLVSFDRA